VPEQRCEGRVKFWKQTWGFITLEDGSDVFVHHGGIDADGYRSLAEGQRVSFLLCEGPKGRYADSVRTL
jgi:cold shock protein